MNSVMEVLEAMRDSFLANRQEDVGTLSAGQRPHEQFFLLSMTYQKSKSQ